MEYQAVIDKTQAMPTERPIYYEGSTGEYWQFVGGEWSQVDQAVIDQINRDKAYIYNAGPSTFWFVSPRSVTFGVRVSFDLNQ